MKHIKLLQEKKGVELENIEFYQDKETSLREEIKEDSSDLEYVIKTIEDKEKEILELTKDIRKMKKEKNEIRKQITINNSKLFTAREKTNLYFGKLLRVKQEAQEEIKNLENELKKIPETEDKTEINELIDSYTNEVNEIEEILKGFLN